MPCVRWLVVLSALACVPFPPSPAAGQRPAELSGLELTYELQSSWLESVADSRRTAALELLAVAEAVVAQPDSTGSSTVELLPEAGRLADRVAMLDRELEEAREAVGQTRSGLIRALEEWAGSLRGAVRAAPPAERSEPAARLAEVEAELRRLRATDSGPGRADPLEGAAPIAALTGVVDTEYRRAVTLNAMREELRLFMAGLRLFDETGMPPSARAGGGGETDPGCPPVACPISESAPGDVPLDHFRPEGLADGSEPTLTPASLARLRDQLAAHIERPGGAADGEHGIGRAPPGDRIAPVAREAVLDAGLTGFRADQAAASAVVMKAAVSSVHALPLGAGLQLMVEPAAGARGFRLGGGTFGEAAGEVRETLSGVGSDRFPWQVMAWQKGRFLSEPLTPPGYLEPGRVEGGLTGRLSVPVRSRWAFEVSGGGDAVRYAPADWEALDRHGLTAALGLAWRRATRSTRLSLRSSHHVFPHPRPGGDRRADTRIDAGIEGTLERTFVAGVSAGWSWSRSTLPAYDFHSARAALVLSAPWGRGSVQAYGALATQRYLNPGPEELRVAPSDRDSGSMVSLRYARPLDAHRTLVLRGAWSRSVTGFHDEFYHRFGTSLQLTFRGR
ncbi:MAG: hypothetical protein R6U63_05625 [Longimicrobiales bacterium]